MVVSIVGNARLGAAAGPTKYRDAAVAADERGQLPRSRIQLGFRYPSQLAPQSGVGGVQ